MRKIAWMLVGVMLILCFGSPAYSSDLFAFAGYDSDPDIEAGPYNSIADFFTDTNASRNLRCGALAYFIDGTTDDFRSNDANDFPYTTTESDVLVWPDQFTGSEDEFYMVIGHMRYPTSGAYDDPDKRQLHKC